MRTLIIILTILALLLGSCGTRTPEIVEVENDHRKLFAWESHEASLCKHEYFYDSTLFTERQIRDAFRLALDIEGEFQLNTISVFERDDIKKLDRRDLKRQYDKIVKELKSLKLPEGKIWETFRQERLQEVKEIFDAKDMQYEAFLTHNFEVFKKHPLYNKDECVTYFTNMLIHGGDSVFVAWKYLIEEILAPRNSNPERFLWQPFYEKINSEHALEYAIIEILTFGLWNCANAQIQNFCTAEKAATEFRKLFIETTVECEPYHG